MVPRKKGQQMNRAMYVVPVAAAITATGLVAVAHAAPRPAHAAAAATAHRNSPTVSTHRGSGTDRAITDAIKRSSLLGDVPASDVAVRTVRLASTDASWASATIHPIDQRTDDARVALHQVNGRWQVVTLGTAGVGCVVPTALRTGLHLICEPGY